MSFEGLLYVSLGKMPLYLSNFLVDRFYPYAACVRFGEGKKLWITPWDVHLTLGLPISGE